jgi:hypothetical protein
MFSCGFSAAKGCQLLDLTWYFQLLCFACYSQLCQNSSFAFESVLERQKDRKREIERERDRNRGIGREEERERKKRRYRKRDIRREREL